MKKQLLFLLLLPPLVRLQAQTQQKPVTDHSSRWSIGLAAGLAVPGGHFAGIETMAGHADTHPGPAAELTVAYRVCRYFDAVVAAGGQLNNGEGIPYGPEPFSQPANVTFRDQNWKIARLTGGGTLNIPLRKNGRLDLFFRELAGIQKTSAADVYKTIPVNPLLPGPLGNRITVTYPGPSFPWTFAWETDAGVNWKWRRLWALIAYTGISGASPATNLTYLVGGDALVTRRSEFSTTTVHANAGIVYYFPY